LRSAIYGVSFVVLGEEPQDETLAGIPYPEELLCDSTILSRLRIGDVAKHTVFFDLIFLEITETLESD
jgi:hypothetical protein